MSKEIEKDFNIGGSVERAVSGDYELKAFAIIGEAWSLTIRNFVSFTPSVFAFLTLLGVIFYVILKVMLGDIAAIVPIFENPESMDVEAASSIMSAFIVATFTFEILIAPIFASMCLMAMSHSAGLPTKFRHLAKGFQFTLPLILVTMVSLLSQGIVNQLLPLISLYLIVAFSNTSLLICEKRIPPMQSMWLSLRAVNKKFFTIAFLYFTVMMMFMLALMLYGIGLVIVVPFFFHLKGILYREMFGIKLKVVASDHPNSDDHDNDDDQNKDTQVFDA